MTNIKYFRNFYKMLEKDPLVSTELYNKHGCKDGPWMYEQYILFPSKTAFVKYIFENEPCFQGIQTECAREGTPNPLKFVNHVRYADALINEWGWRIVFILSDGRILFTNYE